ncbi:hypothetical protein Aduo_013672 [Ancylostoma duodenale]
MMASSPDLQSSWSRSICNIEKSRADDTGKATLGGIPGVDHNDSGWDVYGGFVSKDRLGLLVHAALALA